MTEEVPLLGGNVSRAVVRIGDTVRRPVTPATPAVDALLAHLAEHGFDGAPHPLGRDPEGRQILEYVPGDLAHDLPAMDLAQLARVGGLVRRLHDTARSFEPPAGATWRVELTPDREDLVCHNDLAPWNLVLGEDRWVIIDWDGAGPSTREWELAYAAHGFVGMAGGNDPVVDAGRLAALVDGYGLDRAARRRLLDVLPGPARAMWRLLEDGARTGTEPWARLHAEGHAEHWGPAADYLELNAPTWRRALLRVSSAGR